MTRPLLVIVLALVGAPRLARAGACLDLQDDRDDVDRLEKFTNQKGKPQLNEGNGHPFLCVEALFQDDGGETGDGSANATKRLRARALAACTKVLDRDGETGECVIILAAGGLTKAGNHDVFALVGKLPEDPIESTGDIGFTRTPLYGRMNDPRGVAAVLDMWKAAQPRADAREKKHGHMADWSAWRQTAADVLGQLGGASEKEFLEAQASATKDTHVAKACRDAADAIAKRLKN